MTPMTIWKTMASHVTMTPRGTPFDDDLLDRIRAVVQPGDELRTLRCQHPNKITSIERGRYPRVNRALHAIGRGAASSYPHG